MRLLRSFFSSSATALLLLLALAVPGAGAQEPAPLVLEPAAAGKTQRLTLRDGSQLIGRIVSVEADSVKFESAIGVTAISKDAIIAVKEEAPGHMREGRYYFPNPNATRLIFAPTGRMLAEKEGYFSDYWVFFPGFAVGVSDKFSIGGGMSVIPGISLGEQLYYFTPKVGLVQGPEFNAAVGALVAGIPSIDDEFNDAGILYGVATWGTTDNSFTVGSGYGYANGKLAELPMLMFGGEARASPRISFVSENYIFPNNGFALSGGLRFMGRDVSIDFALATISDNNDSFCCVPFLGVVWKW